MSNEEIPARGRVKMMNEMYQALKCDDHLMRLLYYPFKDEEGDYQNCLDKDELPDIVGSKEHEKIAQTHIIKTVKKDDIVAKKNCFILLHLGKRRPVFNNYLLVRQEVLIDVVVHDSYQNSDNRLDDICDRLDDLFIHERFGLGKVDISTPIPFEAPRGYYRYQLKYLLWMSKK